MKRHAIYLLTLLSLILAACATPSFVRVNDGDTSIGQRLVVRSDGGWNTFEGGAGSGFPTWTVDGYLVDSLRFYADIKDGQPLVAAGDGKRPPFRASMRPHEIVALFEGLFAGGGSVFTLDKLEPAEFLGGKGFRFEFQLLRKDDSVRLRGLAHGAVHNGQLYAIVFMAPRLTFYDRHLPRAMKVIESARLKG